MIEIDGKIVSFDLFTEKFTCDVSRCRGICCVEGNSGAPLEEEEAAVLENEFAAYLPFMKPEGIDAIRDQGFAVTDEEGELTTPLIGGAECAYSCEENGITMCAIEKAWQEGHTVYRKPVSCHLYPVRVVRFGDGTFGLTYHRWNICRSAVECGGRLGVPLYKALHVPLTRRFGEKFYDALTEAEKYLNEELKLSGNIMK